MVGGSKSAAVCHVKRDSFSPKANTTQLCYTKAVEREKSIEMYYFE